ncbi:hypothetical protein LCGC14_2984520, partial [marine sediment metagenome]
DAKTQIVSVDAIPDGWMGLDIGPDSLKEFQKELKECKSVIWNGPMGAFEIGSTRMNGSVVVGLDTALPLRRSRLVADAVTVAGPGGMRVGLDEARLATRPGAGGDTGTVHDLGIEILGLVPDPALRQAIDPAGRLPDKLSRIALDATLTLDAPLDRHSLEGAVPRILRIDLADAAARWGALDLRLSGAVDIDPEGRPTGTVDVTARNWRQMLDLAVAAGVFLFYPFVVFFLHLIGVGFEMKVRSSLLFLHIWIVSNAENIGYCSTRGPLPS